MIIAFSPYKKQPAHLKEACCGTNNETLLNHKKSAKFLNFLVYEVLQNYSAPYSATRLTLVHQYFLVVRAFDF